MVELIIDISFNIVFLVEAMTHAFVFRWFYIKIKQVIAAIGIMGTIVVFDIVLVSSAYKNMDQYITTQTQSELILTN